MPGGTIRSYQGAGVPRPICPAFATQPRAINSQEALACDYLRDAGFMMQRLNQRIIQALGRCNRADDDYGVYVLAGRRFVAHFSQEDRRRGLPASIQAEIDLAENGTELGDDQLVGRVIAFLRRDFGEFDRELAGVCAALRLRSCQAKPVRITRLKR